jgi:Xaa-Pro aminopeptidase
MDVKKMQALLVEHGIDGWLFQDFHNRDHMAYRILGVDGEKMTTRRWYVWVPQEGAPTKVLSAVEQYRLDEPGGKPSVIPGDKIVYRSWIELREALGTFLKPGLKVAMQYSPMNEIPYVSMVDAGTVELVRSYGVEVVTSADLVQVFEAQIDANGYSLHKDAGVIIDGIRRAAFEEIGMRVKAGLPVDEYGMRRWIVERFKDHKLTCDGDEPIVAVNERAADPHFEPTADNTMPIRMGDAVLIDLWARFDRPDGIYYDITWCGYLGDKPPGRQEEVFGVIMAARDAAIAFAQERFELGEPCFGWQVDDACRQVVIDAGFGDYFVHRTGHSIGREVHGNGVNIDNLETRDSRKIVPGICFSIEPGIYIPGEIGVRTEIDLFVRLDGVPEVTGEIQTELLKIG